MCIIINYKYSNNKINGLNKCNKSDCNVGIIKLPIHLTDYDNTCPTLSFYRFSFVDLIESNTSKRSFHRQAL